MGASISLNELEFVFFGGFWKKLPVAPMHFCIFELFGLLEGLH